ncbi:MAG: DUF692 domain-containing protein [Planctomycetia bacterium]|nr:DUF692 domain-containing protein [Planctomycetia bacterium]
MIATTTHRRAYGVGIAYRNCLHWETVQYQSEIDFLEVPTEDYIVRRRRLFSDPETAKLRDALNRWPCVAHGISMSIGSVEPLDEQYLRTTREFMDEFGIDDFSEHLTYHRMDGKDLSVFLCLPFVEESVDWLAAKYNAARKYWGRPFGLENVSYYYPIPHCPWDEARFLTALTERTDCELLLDVTNIYNNATNHGYDAVEFIHRLPGNRIRQLHIAGGHYAEGLLQDSHSAPVFEGVWPLLEEVLKHTAAEMIILERDSNFLPFGPAVMGDIRRAREIFYKHRPAQAPPKAPLAADEPLPAAVPSVDVNNPRFAELRSFQRATMREITDPSYRRRIRANRAAVQADYPMSEAWQRRWQDCDPKRVDLLAAKWDFIERGRRQDDVRYRNQEWGIWAAEAAS